MNDCDNIDICQNHFEGIHSKLDKLDDAIRGNGKVGIIVRLDRLEQRGKTQGKLIWLLMGAIATGLATAITISITG